MLKDLKRSQWPISSQNCFASWDPVNLSWKQKTFKALMAAYLKPEDLQVLDGSLAQQAQVCMHSILPHFHFGQTCHASEFLHKFLSDKVPAFKDDDGFCVFKRKGSLSLIWFPGSYHWYTWLFENHTSGANLPALERISLIYLI